MVAFPLLERYLRNKSQKNFNERVPFGLNGLMNLLDGLLTSGRPLIVTSKNAAVGKSARSMENLLPKMTTKLSPSGSFVTSQAHHWRMKHLVLILLLFAGHRSVLRGEPFEQAEVTKAVNVVSLLPQDVRAAPGDIVEGDTALQTGGYSRAELQFPDLTITRVGSNALFRFIEGTREMVLDSGTMLFSSPKGAGGGKVQAGAVTAAVTGSDFMISNVGKVKVICLSHKVAVYFTANPKIRTELGPRTNARYRSRRESQNASGYDN